MFFNSKKEVAELTKRVAQLEKELRLLQIQIQGLRGSAGLVDDVDLDTLVKEEYDTNL